jgi:uncharacterized integral membrane protein
MIKRIVGWFVLVPLCAVLIVFALANRQSVLVNFNPLVAAEATGPSSVALPLYLVLFGMLLLGVILGGTAAWFAQGPHRRDEKHFRRETERLHRELEVARRSPGNAALSGDEFPVPNRS